MLNASQLRHRLFLLSVPVLAAACSSTEKMPDGNHSLAGDTAGAAVSSKSQDTATTGMSAMGPTSGMTGDADHDFLRMMSDHHKGMIAMAHPTIEMKERLSVKDAARKMDKAQDQEIKVMLKKLKERYGDDYTPEVTPDNQKMVDALKGKSGEEYSRSFLENAIMHHQQAITMIDEYLPKGKDAELKKMATKMKLDQAREIAEFRKKLSAM